MRVMLTGSEGYIGAVLRDYLLREGHETVGLDTGYFSECDFHKTPTSIPLIKRDLRQVERADVEGFDAVFHLAALSNDPLGELEPSLTDAINTQGSIRLAELAKDAGVSRFVFSSSCSMYGQADSQGLTEDSEFHPLTAYARSKVEMEQALNDMASDTFSPTSLRNATAFGLSPRLRFDIVVNNLCGWAWTTGKIVLTSDGSPWRPLVDVRDIARAFMCVLNAPREDIHNEAFNVGSSDNNYQIITVAKHVAGQFPGCEIQVGHSDGDERTYNVDFTKIATKLPGFGAARHSMDAAIIELRAVFEEMALRDEQFKGRLYTRIKQIRHLQDTGRLDEELFWKGETNG